MRRLLLLVIVVVLGLGFGAATAAANTVTATCGPAGSVCDETGNWQLSPVTVTWHVDPFTTDVTGCISQTYTDAHTAVSCAASWGAGSGASLSFPLNVESSNPTATATPDRPPDTNGWYNHPLTISFESGNAISGFAVGACTAPQSFAGPATPGTAISGSCTDNAGKTATASFPFRYDATPPSLTASSQPADGSVNLTWQASSGPAPLQWVQVSRDPGVAAGVASVLYQGGASSYTDSHVRNGTRYTYLVTAVDQAGNVSQRAVTATPGARLLAPAPNARLSAPPTLSWTANPRASYYNVQLFKGKTKMLSAWPTRPSLQLKRRWRFAGHRCRLARGTYRWYVWPGFGSRKAAHYGHRIGSATFVIR